MRNAMRNMDDKKKFFWIALACVVAGFVYWVFPIDLLPDFIGGFGWADDLIFGLIGFIGGMVNFFLGLSVGISLTAPAEERLRFREDQDKMYGTFREV
ncbi:MAG: DUF1232 domain-containing protein [Lachnospiraceae bacterium]|nr:DUF1232 domain-containing protein [Lachnospiraceae bacterium]